MKVLVTGASGFLGKELYNFLKEKGVDAYGTSTKENKDSDMFRIDITRKSDFDILPKGIDTIVHLAAVREQFGSEKSNWEECMKVNAKGTLNVAEFAAREKIGQIIYISSNTVYGRYRKKIRERDKPKPDSIYGKTKYLGEKYCSRVCEKNGIKLAILRVSSVFGASQHKFLVNYILECIKGNKDIIVYGKGRGRWDMLYVKDLLPVIHNVIRSSAEGIYNIGAGKLLSVNEIANSAIKTYKSKSGIIYDKSKNENTDNIIMDISKAKKYLGFKIKYAMEDALKDMKKQKN